MTATTVAFPDHNIDPKQKNSEKFMLQMAKAVWGSKESDMPMSGIFWAKRLKYEEIRAYAMNRQSVGKYQKNITADEESDETAIKISWDPRADGMLLRNIAVAKLQKAGYNIIATPINPQAQDAQDEEYAKARIKIIMRKAMEQQDQEMAQHPMLAKKPGEAEDLDELEMQIDFNPKFVRAKDTEEAVEMVLYDNEAEAEIDAMAEDQVDFGVGVMKEWLDENNKVRLRHVYPGRFGTSYSRKKDFSDIVWAWEVVPTKLGDLVKHFGVDKVEALCKNVMGKDGNPTSMGENTIEDNGLDMFKADVLDIEFISWDKRVTQMNSDDNGNIRISKTKPIYEGKVKPGVEFKAKTVEVVYKCKWVIGTDMVFSFGKAENQKRTVDIATMSKTKLSFHIHAANFHHMKAVGLTETMIPIIDDLNEALYKLRNFRNRMVPNGFDIDVTAIEGVALGSGGKGELSPQQVIDNFFETGVLTSRRGTMNQDGNTNYKAINAISNNMADQIISLANDISNSKQALREITGLNELTDGSTPNPKTLASVANMANEATNNALYSLVNARKKIIESLAKGIVQRLQIALKNGPYDGYNKNTGRWVRVPASIMHFDYDIMLEDRPTQEEKQWLYDLIREDIKAGLLDTSDVIHIINTQNLKNAQMLLAHKAKKSREKAEAQAQANSMMQNQAQAQSNMQAEQIKMQNDQLRHQMEMEKTEMVKLWDYFIAKLKVEQASQAVDTKATADILKLGLQPDQLTQEAGQSQEQMAEPIAT